MAGDQPATKIACHTARWQRNCGDGGDAPTWVGMAVWLAIDGAVMIASRYTDDVP